MKKETWLVGGFKFFQAHGAISGKVRWRFVNNKCSAKVYANINIVEFALTHNHSKMIMLPGKLLTTGLKEKQ